jgi:hypothetical protein
MERRGQGRGRGKRWGAVKMWSIHHTDNTEYRNI